MLSSRTLLSDGSATISDDRGATTETDLDMVDSKDDAVDSSFSPDSCPFKEGERVLAYHNQFIYEAKVQKIEFRLKEWKFYVHYLGWNKNWDEWVGVDRLMKHTDENIQKQQAIDKKEENARTGRASLTKQKTSAGTRGKKRRNDFVPKEKVAAPSEKLVNIQIPPILKKQLVDDCDFVTHLGKLVKLPRTPNVEEILNKYLEFRLKKDTAITDSVKEILNGLRCYFEKALPAILLYKSEREQYREAVADNVSPSSVYGAEHLLRLFVKLPELLYHANIEEETLTELQQKLLDFLKFLQKNQSSFFLSTYQTYEGFETNIKKQSD